MSLFQIMGDITEERKREPNPLGINWAMKWKRGRNQNVGNSQRKCQYLFRCIAYLTNLFSSFFLLLFFSLFIFMTKGKDINHYISPIFSVDDLLIYHCGLCILQSLSSTRRLQECGSVFSCTTICCTPLLPFHTKAFFYSH